MEQRAFFKLFKNIKFKNGTESFLFLERKETSEIKELLEDIKNGTRNFEIFYEKRIFVRQRNVKFF